MKALSRLFVLLLCLLPLPVFAQSSTLAPSAPVPTTPSSDGTATPDPADPAAQETESSSDPSGFRVYWRDGFRAETNDGQFQLRLGGRLQTDLSWGLEERPFGGRFGTIHSDIEVRRARVHLQGYVWERVEYKVEVDFAGGEVSAKDMYIGVRGWATSARFGHMKEPFSLEELNSSRFTTFIERSLANMFAPSRNTGLMASSSFGGDRGTWTAGVFRESDGFVSSPGDNYNVTGRVTHAPVVSDDSRRVVHLGVSATHKWIDGNLRLGSRPSDHTAPRLVAVDIPATSANIVAIEAAANVGALGVQAEYVSSWVSSDAHDDPRLYGYYLQARYGLTGESRPYDGGQFVRLSPARNFPGGPGAWELAVRYALVDVAAAADQPARLWNLTTGLNWYWNPNLRLMFNHEVAQLPQLNSDAFSSFHIRVSFDF